MRAAGVGLLTVCVAIAPLEGAGTRSARGNPAARGQAAAGEADVYQQDPGPHRIVCLEAERCHAKVDRGAHGWKSVTSPPGHSGAGAMQVLPDNGTSFLENYVNVAPRLDLNVNFVSAGRYYVWIYGTSTDGEGGGDSCHVGLDGQAQAPCAGIGGFGTCGVWSWSNPESATYLNVPTPGVHTVNVWPREDGFLMDRLVLTANAQYIPSRQGPLESPRKTGGNVNGSPWAEIVSPRDGSLIAGPAAIRIEAAAFDADGSVARVECFAGKELLGVAEKSPYAFAWNDPPKGNHVLTVRVIDHLGAAATSQAVYLTCASGDSDDGAFLQDATRDGILSVEGEHFHAQVEKGQHRWQPVTSPRGHSGAGAMGSSPDIGSAIEEDLENKSPRLDYRVVFQRAGKHYVWIRGAAPSGQWSADSCFLGLNGRAASGCLLRAFGEFWCWSRPSGEAKAILHVPSPGVHTISVWMREDGFILDKFVLTTNPQYLPVGAGPPESSRIGRRGTKK